MVKLGACGVCHSDLSATNGTIPLPPPLVLGHEAAGTVAEVGEGVTDIAVGDTIVVSWIPMCGKCRYCIEGRPALCDMAAKATVTLPDGTHRFKDKDGKPLNHMAGTGVMAEYATLHRDNVIKIDPSIGDRKSTRLNSSHVQSSYAVFCLKKKTKNRTKLKRDQRIKDEVEITLGIKVM